MDTDVTQSRKPAGSTNFFNWIFFTWTVKLFRKGALRDLTVTDLDSPSSVDESEHAANALEREWKVELAIADLASSVKDEKGKKVSKKREPSLLRAIVRTFWFPYMINGIFLFTQAVILRVIQPHLQEAIIGYFSSNNSEGGLTKNEAYLQALGLVGVTFGIVLISHHTTLGMQRIGMRIRVACCSLVYRKILRLDLTTLSNTAAGQVVNLLSNDVSRFDTVLLWLHYVWIMPIQMVVIGYVMWDYVGVAALIGIASVIIQTIPIQGYMSAVSAKLRAIIAMKTDDRVQIMSELVTGIQVVKVYAWEKPFESLVSTLRAAELELITRASSVRAFAISGMSFSERVNLYCTLVSFALFGNTLTAESSFVLATFFNTIQLTVAYGFPQAIIMAGETAVSIRRLKEFLLMEEIKVAKNSERVEDNALAAMEKKIRERKHDAVRIEMERVAANWVHGLLPPTLCNVSIVVQSQSLCGLVGSVGSGKSSLLHVILGELPAAAGTLSFFSENNGNVPLSARALRFSYSSQDPWLFSGSIRDNILFGFPYDKERYDEARYYQRKSILGIATHVTIDTLPGSIVSALVSIVTQKQYDIIVRELFIYASTTILKDSETGETYNLPVFKQDHDLPMKDLRHAIRISKLHKEAIARQRINAIQTPLNVQVTRVCALLTDFEQLPHGDLSFVGERGSSLSGGQRARVNLARAVYRDADVYLLDDPLSAVDAPVGRHLFEECITGFLRGKTRILVTHQLQFLQKVDTVVILDQGFVIGQGKFDDLANSELSSLKTLQKDDTEKDQDEMKVEGHDDGNRLTRQLSTKKSSAKNEDNMKDADAAEARNSNAEAMETGKMSNKVYATYFAAGGSICSLMFLTIVYLAGQVATSGVDYWVSYWTNEQVTKTALMSTASTNSTSNITVDDSFWYDENGLFRTEAAIYIYTITVLSCVGLVIFRNLFFIKCSMNSSRNIHNLMFSNLLTAKLRFFNTNPSGRIMNRFSKDVGAMDELLPKAILEGVQIFLVMIGIIVLVIISNYWMAIPTVVIGCIFYVVRIYYLQTAQGVKRLEGVAKSPVFSHVESTLHGLVTIRSREDSTVKALCETFDRYQDTHTAAWYAILSSAGGFGFFLDVLSCIFIGCVCFLFISTDDGMTASSTVGLAISQSLILTGMLQYGVRQTAEVVSQMTSVERVLQYTKLPKERPFTSDKPLALTWPKTGSLKFKEVNMKYSEQEPPVLKDLNIDIISGWKVGIVGRTGAGKSSLISALFRLVDDGLTGVIDIDGVDTKSIGLHELRRRISIIPQEPVLFSASLRYNLDPFDQFSDTQLWDCLREVELSNAVPSLDYQVSGGGANFSMGQRQLICLARAILRNNRILVLDEATANIDPHTDSLIQNTIRRRFADFTVLTIAHRLNTIMDSDRVLVMDQGSVMEFDHPYLLLQNPEGYFSRMVQQTGKSMAENLALIARQSYASYSRVKRESLNVGNTDNISVSSL